MELIKECIKKLINITLNQKENITKPRIYNYWVEILSIYGVPLVRLSAYNYIYFLKANAYSWHKFFTSIHSILVVVVVETFISSD